MSDLKPQMLVLAPHPDDGILGAGGTMARFIKAGGEVTVLIVEAHMPPLFSNEIFHSSIQEVKEAHSMIGVKESIFLNKPALSLRAIPAEKLNRVISDVLNRVSSDIFIVPYFDRHTDHRVVFESAMVVARPFTQHARPSVVAAYETLSSTHDSAFQIEPNFQPNWIVDISLHIEAKVEMLRCCTTQMREFPHPRSLEAVRALAQFRGTQAGVHNGESFQIIRITAPPELLGRPNGQEEHS